MYGWGGWVGGWVGGGEAVYDAQLAAAGVCVCVFVNACAYINTHIQLTPRTHSGVSEQDCTRRGGGQRGANRGRNTKRYMPAAPYGPVEAAEHGCRCHW